MAAVAVSLARLHALRVWLRVRLRVPRVRHLVVHVWLAVRVVTRAWLAVVLVRRYELVWVRRLRAVVTAALVALAVPVALAAVVRWFPRWLGFGMAASTTPVRDAVSVSSTNCVKAGFRARNAT